ncbi:UPF0598 protein CG30010 [Drosophila santomea]|uniref:UPF0598 protein CG30010 n=1 Tax=Drosophila santomea TaxID=129105 RepID=UPI0019530C8D|nr:UPF0598 protein CG30010 [Drosophila santomea]
MRKPKNLDLKTMFILRSRSIINLKFARPPSTSCRYVQYNQGQSPEPKIREYFYFIDHEGMLFLDDAKMKNFTSCFKEKDFLKFFFNRLRLNKTNRYESEFPYISLCGRERNFIRCDDTPVVFTEQLRKDDKEALSYAHSGPVLTLPYEPHKLYMDPRTGRVYHPATPQVGGIGLVRSKLAIELSQHFEFPAGEASPTHFRWNGERLELQNEWVCNTQRFPMNEECK